MPAYPYPIDNVVTAAELSPRLRGRAVSWMIALRNGIVEALSCLEKQHGEHLAYAQFAPPVGQGDFVFRKWTRGEAQEGEGVAGMLRGRFIEKAGVNVSVVGGALQPAFQREVSGGDTLGQFFASGVSVVIHFRSPKIPALHFNTRIVATDRAWFGGAWDINPCLPTTDNSSAFHDELRALCAPFGAEVYADFSAQCDAYFRLPHRRNILRGEGGIFFDHMSVPPNPQSPKSVDNTARPRAVLDDPFLFVRRMGQRFIRYLPQHHSAGHAQWSAEEEAAMLAYRGRYAEFNLIHDRGTRFGLKTGADADALLMSLPPRAVW